MSARSRAWCWGVFARRSVGAIRRASSTTTAATATRCSRVASCLELTAQCFGGGDQQLAAGFLERRPESYQSGKVLCDGFSGTLVSDTKCVGVSDVCRTGACKTSCSSFGNKSKQRRSRRYSQGWVLAAVVMTTANARYLIFSLVF